MSDITIPPEAVKKAQTAAEKVYGTQFFKEEIEAACTAMLEAWPGIQLHAQDINATESYFVLPIQENQNDKG